MNVMNYDRKTLKERARTSLRGVQPRPWKTTLVYFLVALILPLVVTLVFNAVGMKIFISNLLDTGILEMDMNYPKYFVRTRKTL